MAEKDTNPQQAVENLERALLHSPNNREAFGLRGDIFKSLGKYDEADKDYDRAFRNISDKSVYPSKLAETAFLRKNNENALKQINKAIEANPSVSEYYSLKGKILISSGKNKEAEACMKKAEYLNTGKNI